MRIVAKWVIVALSFLALPHIISGITIDSFQTALIVALVWGVVNLIIRPIILLLFLPVTIITLGLFTFVVNAMLFWGVGSFVDGFEVSGFVPAFFGALIISAVSVVVNILFKSKDN